MTAALLPELPHLMIEDQVRAALIEDLGRAGDITTNATIGADRQATAGMNSREAGIIAGLPLAEAAFRLINPAINFEALVADGARVEPGAMIARISGPARGVLSAERVALNFLMHLSGIATYTARFADA
ncbi:MAG: nicotinate-nucleotide diphosphorylase (carboxylating), partial [Hoeflea sp.]|nr:nicotinate-nucleotide diphosphorylase (carboxylating) [Hoeflea sp.]